ncbi:hypothetical protein [Kocuria turfanensis]|uniref:Uncharacterized protein n=1 Tax=Kocuria turfanensis TaxID=388357 RepID=A0A512IA67_9MICC|nr:hypothetical protein [Kocuria turfanensis]GEO94593.1 hypothetical protein KTU01_07160 [Kocuria turfanensis]
MTEWEFNHHTVSDEDTLYRRIPKKPDFRTWDPLTGRYTPNPAAFRREAQEGMSTHLDSVLQGRSRLPITLYDPDRYGSVGFHVATPRQANAGVLLADDPYEKDEDLRCSHAEVRPPQPEKNRKHWKTVANEIAMACWWVQDPA